ncbi:hypothetical protein HDU96_010314 [Phlyctochytrium bullatum]|nr:hypothetical protein HDU96_010314 [Phlyctochytrium bullatum]
MTASDASTDDARPLATPTTRRRRRPSPASLDWTDAMIVRLLHSRLAHNAAHFPSNAGEGWVLVERDLKLAFRTRAVQRLTPRDIERKFEAVRDEVAGRWNEERRTGVKAPAPSWDAVARKYMGGGGGMVMPSLGNSLGIPVGLGPGDDDGDSSWEEEDSGSQDDDASTARWSTSSDDERAEAIGRLADSLRNGLESIGAGLHELARAIEQRRKRALEDEVRIAVIETLKKQRTEEVMDRARAMREAFGEFNAVVAELVEVVSQRSTAKSVTATAGVN